MVNIAARKRILAERAWAAIRAGATPTGAEAAQMEWYKGWTGRAGKGALQSSEASIQRRTAETLKGPQKFGGATATGRRAPRGETQAQLISRRQRDIKTREREREQAKKLTPEAQQKEFGRVTVQTAPALSKREARLAPSLTEAAQKFYLGRIPYVRSYKHAKSPQYLTGVGGTRTQIGLDFAEKYKTEFIPMVAAQKFDAPTQPEYTNPIYAQMMYEKELKEYEDIAAKYPEGVPPERFAEVKKEYDDVKILETELKRQEAERESKFAWLTKLNKAVRDQPIFRIGGVTGPTIGKSISTLTIPFKEARGGYDWGLTNLGDTKPGTYKGQLAGLLKAGRFVTGTTAGTIKYISEKPVTSTALIGAGVITGGVATKLAIHAPARTAFIGKALGATYVGGTGYQASKLKTPEEVEKLFGERLAQAAALGIGAKAGAIGIKKYSGIDYKLKLRTRSPTRKTIEQVAPTSKQAVKGVKVISPQQYAKIQIAKGKLGYVQAVKGSSFKTFVGKQKVDVMGLTQQKYSYTYPKGIKIPKYVRSRVGQTITGRTVMELPKIAVATRPQISKNMLGSQTPYEQVLKHELLHFKYPKLREKLITLKGMDANIKFTYKLPGEPFIKLYSRMRVPIKIIQKGITTTVGTGKIKYLGQTSKIKQFSVGGKTYQTLETPKQYIKISPTKAGKFEIKYISKSTGKITQIKTLKTISQKFPFKPLSKTKVVNIGGKGKEYGMVSYPEGGGAKAIIKQAKIKSLVGVKKGFVSGRDIDKVFGFKARTKILQIDVAGPKIEMVKTGKYPLIKDFGRVEIHYAKQPMYMPHIKKVIPSKYGDFLRIEKFPKLITERTISQGIPLSGKGGRPTGAILDIKFKESRIKPLKFISRLYTSMGKKGTLYTPTTQIKPATVVQTPTPTTGIGDIQVPKHLSSEELKAILTPSRSLSGLIFTSLLKQPSRTITRQPSRTITRNITRQITPTITRQITPSITRQITPTITRTITPTITRTITPTTTKIITPTYQKFIIPEFIEPPIILPPIDFRFPIQTISRKKRKKYKLKVPRKYQHSLSAREIFNAPIYTKKIPKVLTGLQIRPILR